MNFRIVGAILRKDILSLAPIVVLTFLLFLADPIIMRLDLLPVWTSYSVPVILVALVVLILPVFHQMSESEQSRVVDALRSAGG